MNPLSHFLFPKHLHTNQAAKHCGGSSFLVWTHIANPCLLTLKPLDAAVTLVQFSFFCVAYHALVTHIDLQYFGGESSGPVQGQPSAIDTGSAGVLMSAWLSPQKLQIPLHSTPQRCGQRAGSCLSSNQISPNLDLRRLMGKWDNRRLFSSFCVLEVLNPNQTPSAKSKIHKQVH